jgi:molybdate transport system regulatory protein
VDEYDRIIFGEGRREILENIRKTGSINQAAKLMKMSYKGVWSKIRATEQSLNAKIVQTEGRRGTVLTEHGKELLEKYKAVKEICLEEDDKAFNSVFPAKNK